MSEDPLIPLDAIRAARAASEGLVDETPMMRNRVLSDDLGRQVDLKLELFQRTGSFKPRGAITQLKSLALADKPGVVGVSGGNFARGLAYAGASLGTPTIVVMPETVPRSSVEATRRLGATVELVSTVGEAFERAAEHVAEGWVAAHPFDAPSMMAGNGAVGVEILEQQPAVTDLVVSIGGGGFIAGVTSAVKALSPTVRVWGVETVGADTMRQALDVGHVVQIDPRSIATTLGAPFVSERALSIVREYVEDVVVVEDGAAVAAMERLIEAAKIFPEPAAACTLAAVELLGDRLGDHVVLVMCGGNVSPDDLSRWRASL